MTKITVDESNDLRSRAEQAVDKLSGPFTGDPETLRLLHELQVHQIELEMQNAELLQTREDVEMSLEKYTNLFDFAPTGYFILDRNGVIRTVNLSGARLLGIERSLIVGRRLDQFVTVNFLPVYTAFLHAVFSSQDREMCEVALLNNEHLPLTVQIIAESTAPGEECLLSLIDITRLRQTEEKLLRSRRIQTIGQIAGGVAHEVSNPLNAILTITEALFREKGIEDNPEYGLHLMHMRTQISRLSFLMNELLNLGRTVPVNNIYSVSLYHVCLEAIASWNSRGGVYSFPVTFVTESDAVNTCVMADRGRLIQIIINLLENAAQHSAGSAHIILRLIDCEASGSRGPMVTIQIADVGSGIKLENLSQVFDPFFSARAGGTGLGLALVKHFVEEAGGEVSIINNNPPPGCTAEVNFPKSLEKCPDS
jgi:PAS domain S-box-containing protein